MVLGVAPICYVVFSCYFQYWFAPAAVAQSPVTDISHTAPPFPYPPVIPLLVFDKLLGCFGQALRIEQWA